MEKQLQLPLGGDTSGTKIYEIYEINPYLYPVIREYYKHVKYVSSTSIDKVQDIIAASGEYGTTSHSAREVSVYDIMKRIEDLECQLENCLKVAKVSYKD